MIEEQYYTLGEVTELLKVSERTVHRWIQSGALLAYKPGGEWRIRSSDLEAFLETRKGPTPKARSFSPVAADTQTSEERSDSLNELGETYRDTQEGVNRLSAIWEERLATGKLDRASVEEFVENTWALVPALRDALTGELVAVAGVLAMGEEEMLDEDGNFSPELLSLSTLDPVVDRYFTVGRRVVEVWETRFAGKAEAASNVTYLFDRARTPSRHRQVG